MVDLYGFKTLGLDWVWINLFLIPQGFPCNPKSQSFVAIDIGSSVVQGKSAGPTAQPWWSKIILCYGPFPSTWASCLVFLFSFPLYHFLGSIFIFCTCKVAVFSLCLHIYRWYSPSGLGKQELNGLPHQWAPLPPGNVSIPGKGPHQVESFYPWLGWRP